MDDNNNLINPFKISYTGKHADRHVLDAVQFGESISAAAKIYVSVMHLCVTGEVPRGNYKKEFSCFAEAPKAGSLEALLFLAPVLADGHLFATTHKEALSSLFWLMVDFIKKIWTGSPEDKTVKELTNTISQMASQQSELATILANGLISANDNMLSGQQQTAALHESLIRTIPEIAGANRNHARKMVAPVGRSCSQILQTSNGTTMSEISEPEAAAIRSKDDLVVCDTETMQCSNIIELNLRTGHCEVQVDRYEGTVIGKITDPQLEQAGNIYSRSLDRQTAFTITAKAVMKDDRVHCLFISDATE